MLYRPLGKAGVTVSALALAVDDRAGERGSEALAGLIYAAMEAGVNAFHIESREPEVLQTVGRSLAAVERRLLFVSLRLGVGSPHAGVSRDFSPDALAAGIEQALEHTGLERLDLVVLDDPTGDELPTTALAALERQRTAGRVGLLGVGGSNPAMDFYLGGRAFDVLGSPYHLRSGWTDLNRIKTGARLDMGVIAYDYFPEAFRLVETTPGGVRKKRSLLAALAGAPRPHPLQGMGTYAFLHETKSWTAEELCLAYALMEPSVSTVLIRAHERERLEALLAVPDRDLPPGMAAKVEMARFGLEPVVTAPAGRGGLMSGLKVMVPHFDAQNIRDSFDAVRARIADLRERAESEQASNAKGGSKKSPVLPQIAANWPLRLPLPDPSRLLAKAVAPTKASSGEPSGGPAETAPPPAAARPQTVIWRSKDYDYPVEPTGESFPGPDGRTYLKVHFDGLQTFVPADELIFPEGATPPQPAPANSEAPAPQADVDPVRRLRSRRKAS